MNTLNAYLKKISSVTILALLLFSGLLIAIPLTSSVFASNANLPSIKATSGNPVLGATAGIVVTLTISNPSTNQYTVTAVTVNAPSGWTMTGCTKGGYLFEQVSPGCTISGTGSSVTYTVSNFYVGTGSGVPPGANDIVTFTATSPGATTTYPFTSTFTTKVQDASALNFYDGPSFNLIVMDPTTSISVSVTPGGSNTATTYTAGTTPYSVTATVACTVSTACPSGTEALLPIVWSDKGTGATAAYPSSFSPASGPTGPVGTQTSTFQPSDTAGTTGIPTATIGTSTCALCSASAPAITTVAGPPSEISFTFTNYASDSNHYVTTEGTTTNTNTASATFTGAKVPTSEISFSIADQFGNPQLFSAITLYTITLTAESGGGLFDAATLPAVITCTAGGAWHAGTLTGTSLGGSCPSTGSKAAIPFTYYQSPIWGTIGYLSATVSGTYASASFSGSGASNEIITSTFALKSPTPVIVALSGTTPNFPYIYAGDNVNVTAIVAGAGVAPSTCNPALCPPQQGVPVALFLDNATSYETIATAHDYGANSKIPIGFSNGAINTTSLQLTTNSAGQVSALFTLDTFACEPYPTNPCTSQAGAHAFYFSNVTAPSDLSLTASLGPSPDSMATASVHAVITIPGVPNSFTINAYFEYNSSVSPHGALLDLTKTAAASGSSVKDSPFVNIVISDKYGNLAINPGPSNLQINLVASGAGGGGLPTATSVYIPASCADTTGIAAACQAPFGPIQWTMPSSLGTVTLTATGVITGQTISNYTSISVVSPSPTLNITSPTPGVNNVIYSKSTSVVFKGQANVSLGYSPTAPAGYTPALVSIASVTYSVDGGTVQKAVITPGSTKVVFSVAASFTKGLHTIQFNASDTIGNKIVGGKYSVLVDTSAPTIKFLTHAKAEVNSTSPLQFTVTDPEGDLGWISVKANGTAISQSLISVTPSVNSTSTLGLPTTYTVTASLPSGMWSVTVGATNLAGLAATPVAEVVTAVLATDLSFTAKNVAQSTFAAQPAIEATVTNNLPTAYSAIVYATISGSGNIPTATISNLAAGGSTQIFLSLAGLAPGTYTVTFVVYSTQAVPLSVPYSTTVTIS